MHCDGWKGIKMCDRTVFSYFHLGYENQYEKQVILAFLNSRHGITMSLATLKQRLHDYGLSRSYIEVDDQQLREVVQREISGPGELRGYRAVWHSLRINHHIHVPRNRVADLRELNPARTKQQQSRKLTRRRCTSYGPKLCWHVNGKNFN